VVSIFVAMGALRELPLWLVVAVVSRDVLIVSAVMLSWLLGRPVRMKPFALSKLNTAAQLVLAAMVLADIGFALGLGTLREALIWLTALLTIGSLAAYLHAWLRHMAGLESGKVSP
jgi:cardiolipin synthase (CMP-forming)